MLGPSLTELCFYHHIVDTFTAADVGQAQPKLVALLCFVQLLYPVTLGPTFLAKRFILTKLTQALSATVRQARPVIGAFQCQAWTPQSICRPPGPRSRSNEFTRAEEKRVLPNYNVGGTASRPWVAGVFSGRTAQGTAPGIRQPSFQSGFDGAGEQ